jgi:hypothetical protein
MREFSKQCVDLEHSMLSYVRIRKTMALSLTGRCSKTVRRTDYPYAQDRKRFTTSVPTHSRGEVQ